MTLAELLASLGDLQDGSARARRLGVGAPGQGDRVRLAQGGSRDTVRCAARARRWMGRRLRHRRSRGARSPSSRSARAPADVQAPWIVVPDARLALARLAAVFYGHPSRELRVVGITGTNGKTTTAYLVSALFEAAGIQCGMLGTIVYRIGDEDRPATRTTPESVDIQQMLREMVEAALRRVRDGGVVARARAVPRGSRATSPPACSRTSRGTTSTITTTWSRTSGRSAASSSCFRPARPQSSMPTIPGGWQSPNRPGAW